MPRAAPPAVPPLPSLAACLSRLASLVSSPFCPPALFLHDPKQSPVLVEAILQLIHASRPPPAEPPRVGDLLPVVAHLDLAQVHSVKQALDRILAQFSGQEEVATHAASQWDERSQGVKAWDRPSLELLRVVEHAPSRKRITPANEAERHGRKRKRLRRGEVDSVTPGSAEEDGAAEGSGIDEDALDAAGDMGTTRAWSLEWDPDDARNYVAAPEPQTLPPFRNSLDAFHDSLRAVFAFADEHSSPEQAGIPPQRRFLVLEHGELLSELAGAGKASGAARETGVGVTFASTVYRLAELTGLPVSVITVSRLPWRKLRESMVGLPSPELLTLEDVSSDDAVTLLTTRFADSSLANPAPNETLRADELIELFRSLAFIVCTTFGKVVTDLEDFAYLAAKFWPRWKAVREQSNPPIAPTDVARLSIALKPEFAAELDKMFLPRAALTALAPTALPTSGHQSGGPGAGATFSAQPLGFTGKIASLPKQPTFLAPVVSTTSMTADGRPSDPFAGAADDDGPDAFFSSAASSATPSPVKRPVPITPTDPFVASAPLPLAGPSRALAAAAGSGRIGPPSAAVSSHAALAKSLPLAARYLLIAAYFAAHNPPKSDVRVFVRVDDLEGVPKKGKKVKRRGGTAKKMGRSPSKAAASATSLSGGKAFAYERLVAIFDSIVDSRLEYALGTVAIAAQVNTLAQLRLLHRASSENNADKVLDGVKLRCGLARDAVEALAVSVGWKEWKERLVGEQV
ncbi:hypothetical protein JCM3774_004912 [Rhodotorula dairenensis]